MLSEVENKPEKNLLIFVGSPRKRGNSHVLAREFIRILKENNCTYDVIEADNSFPIYPCLACGYCRDNLNQCVRKDKLTPYIENIENYNGIVFISPVYFFSFTAQTKAFLDRLGAVDNWERLSLTLITCSGSSGRMGGSELIAESLIRTCEWHNSKFIGHYNKVTGDDVLPISNKDTKALYNLIQNIKEVNNEESNKDKISQIERENSSRKIW